ncbi:PadR family transcriptional regulator [Oscillatoria sp. FACHB-1407]|uniref:PadR family transcriptional regulator n=1 Tax=Oscillatoria sp. FACHB-1407 TaxID=2692847 RepID=UPI00168219A1|nr:PadR family transcriptional regulator [Oscillatoria sp. FACHB-1407]MBD2461389.1 PadR family transcriptional regulator [Oscillatoria sp. FACHB-1407]
MSLAHIILGLLQQEERTGYDLKTTCFDGCIAHLWQADQAQIYRTLDKLEEQGWIHCTVEIQHDRPNRKVYTVTEAGKAELIRWLQSPQTLPIVRDPLLVQIHFAALLPDEAVIHLLQCQLAGRRQKLAECEAMRSGVSNEVVAQTVDRERSTSREYQMQQLAIDLAIRREQTYLDWLQSAIAQLQQLQNDGLEEDVQREN